MTDFRLASAEKAEEAFYIAFASADVEAMMAVWADDADVVCIHPHGPRLVGQSEIRESWRQIMRNSPPIHFKISELNRVEDGDLAVHYVNEHIHVGDASEPEFTILATNVYRRTGDGWRMILHHASPTPEAIQEAEAEQEPKEQDVTLH